jgi:MFS family permease
MDKTETEKDVPDQGSPPAEQPKQGKEKPKPSTTSTVLILAPAFLSMFLVAIDRTIISTVCRACTVLLDMLIKGVLYSQFANILLSSQAIPSITDEFNSLNDVGWYGSAYLLTCCAFQMLFGKVFTFYPVKHVFLASILVFEVASAVCGAAPTSVAFIVGRAIAGVGAAGIFAGTVSNS